jgi:uncharacterized membrane protein YphA (DoxX/SURF4 family)
MANDFASRKQAVLEYAGVAARCLLGGLFIYMGVAKAVHPENFLKLVDQYQMVRDPLLLNSIAAALPWFEVFCGLLLVGGVAVRGSALMLIFMLVPFTLVILKRALSIAGAKGLALCAVKFDCGCGMGEVFACHKIVENCLLILISCWLLCGRGRALALRFELMQAKRSKYQATGAPGSSSLTPTKIG